MVHSERFVDSWIEETFIWMLATSVYTSIFENFNFEVF